MDFVFATKNEGKLKEASAILKAAGHSVISPTEAGVDLDIAETGATFMENALIKARAAARVSGRPALADDSGLEIDFLNNGPGVYSARYLGEETPYEIKNKKILEMMRDIPDGRRGARFVCAVAFADNNGCELTANAVLEGSVAFKAAGGNGFGYDPIFYLPDYGATCAQLTDDIKNKISHRGKALRLMCEILSKKFS